MQRAGTRACVTNWTGRSVSVIDTDTQRVIRTITLSPPTDPLLADHPTAVVANPRSDQLYVANTNSDTVPVIDSNSGRVVATVPVGVTPTAPKRATPQVLAVSPDGGTRYVADAGENAVAVVDLARRAVGGFVPTGAYPSGVAVTPDGGRLVIWNINGSGAGARQDHPVKPPRCRSRPR